MTVAGHAALQASDLRCYADDAVPYPPMTRASTHRRAAWWCPLLLLLAACSGAGREPFARISGFVFEPDIDEVSGVAVSHVHPDVLWAHNDGGNAAVLYALSRRGSELARYTVEGVTNTDWEDIASFDLDGHHYLLIADTGDNGGLRRSLQLHVIEEPRTLESGSLKPAWSISFRWPDGPRDTEAATVDADSGQVLLITKKRQPPQLFAVPLHPAGTGAVTARLLGELAGVPQADAETRERNPFRARIHSQITSADLDRSGQKLAVITYDNLLLYRRTPGEDWAQAISRPPWVHALPWLPQAEAVGWTPAGRHLYLMGEITPSPIWLLTPPPS